MWKFLNIYNALLHQNITTGGTKDQALNNCYLKEKWKENYILVKNLIL